MKAIAALSFVVAFQLSLATRTAHMWSGCRDDDSPHYSVKKSLKLYGASPVPGYTFGSCTAFLTADGADNRLMIRFTSLSMLFMDRVNVYDGDSRNDRKLTSHSLGGSNPFINRVFRSSGRYLTVVFRGSGGHFSNAFSSVITEFRTGECSASEFECCDGDCIARSLTHNWDSNCQDKSDESYSDCDADHHGVSTGVIAGSVAGTVGFLIFVVCVASCCCSSHRRSGVPLIRDENSTYQYVGTPGSTYPEHHAPPPYPGRQKMHGYPY